MKDTDVKEIPNTPEAHQSFMKEAYRDFRLKAREAGVQFTVLAWSSYISSIAATYFREEVKAIETFHVSHPEIARARSPDLEQYLLAGAPSFGEALDATDPLLLNEERSRVYTAHMLASIDRSFEREVTAELPPTALDQKIGKILSGYQRRLKAFSGLTAGYHVASYIAAIACDAKEQFKANHDRHKGLFDESLEKELGEVRESFSQLLTPLDRELSESYRLAFADYLRQHSGLVAVLQRDL